MSLQDPHLVTPRDASCLDVYPLRLRLSELILDVKLLILTLRKSAITPGHVMDM